MKRHQLDLFSLITGLTFVAIAVVYLMDAAGRLSVNGRLVIPLLLIALGVAGLAAAVYRMANGQRSAAAAPEAGAESEPQFQASAPVGLSRYDSLSPDLEALGLLDDPVDPVESAGPTDPEAPRDRF
ncbi:hypothetical protein [Streptacidiphilus sp. PAMC 29251]